MKTYHVLGTVLKSFCTSLISREPQEAGEIWGSPAALSAIQLRTTVRQAAQDRLSTWGPGSHAWDLEEGSCFSPKHCGYLGSEPADSKSLSQKKEKVLCYGEPAQGRQQGRQQGRADAQSALTAVRTFWVVMVDTCHCTFVQNYEMHTSGVSFNVSRGIWQGAVRQYSLLSNDKGTTLVGTLTVRAYACGGTGIYGNLRTLLSVFSQHWTWKKKA